MRLLCSPTAVLASCCLAGFFAPTDTLAAPPKATLSVKALTSGAKLKFSFRNKTSATSCDYNLYGARTKAGIKAAKLSDNALVRLRGKAQGRSILVDGLSRLRSKARAFPLLFSVRLTCGDTISDSATVSVSLPTSRSDTSQSPTKYLSTLKSKLLLKAQTSKRVFENVSLSAPLDLQSPHDGTGRLFIAEQEGRIKVLTPQDSNNRTATVADFLDISSIVTSGGEKGLLGLAFHPQFSQNGFFYVNYTTTIGSDLTSVIARYHVDPNTPNTADSGSELRLLTYVQPFENHNGGGLTFGNDGYLYIATGDGGSGGDPLGNGQHRDTLFGKILRIDVDHDNGLTNYSIPSDNPYRGNGSGYREEIFAYGVRNPFKISTDTVTGKIWAGDVGQNLYEEVDIIENGKNYGWNTMEGFHCYSSDSCDKTGLTLPVAEYSHAVGEAITGGYVYRGSLVPALKGRYLYADFVHGTVFSLDTNKLAETPLTHFDTTLDISSFGTDDEGELYYLSYSEGAIYQFKER